MGRGKTKTDKRGPLQRLRDRETAQDNAAPLVNDFAMQHGDYERAHAIEGQAINLKAMINRGGDPVARWRNAGMLSDTQIRGIEHCISLWQKIGGSARLVANLDRTVFGSPGDGNLAEIEARSDLARIKGGFPRQYWDVFEMVVRFDEPAGVAGSRLANDDSSRRAKAHAIVCMVADMITMRERLSA